MQQTTWLFNHGVDVRAPHELRDRLARVKKAPAILPRGRGLNNNTGRHTRNNAAVPWLLFVSRATLLTKLSPQIKRWNFLVPLDFFLRGRVLPLGGIRVEVRRYFGGLE
jgi:hypothetical protein